MFESNRRTRKLVTQIVVALVLILQTLIEGTDAAARCHKCTGINCQRTSYTATEECVDALDSCVTVFQGSTVLAQGCFGKLAVDLRNKCQMQADTNAEHEIDVVESEELPTPNGDCYQCNKDLCNSVSGEGFECIQCDSNADGTCASNAENFRAEKCPIARSMNSYCYTKLEGKRAIRGCATSLIEQNDCLNNNDCTLCSPLDISGCNREPKVASDSSGSGSEGNGGSSSGSGGGTGTGNDGTSSGGGGSGTGNGGSSSGGGGSNSGGSGSGSGTGNGGSNSGGGGSSSGGNGGGGSTGGGGGTGAGDGGSSSGDGGSGSGNGNGSGNDASDSGNENVSGTGSLSNFKLLTTTLIILLAFLKY